MVLQITAINRNTKAVHNHAYGRNWSANRNRRLIGTWVIVTFHRTVGSLPRVVSIPEIQSSKPMLTCLNGSLEANVIASMNAHQPIAN
jgi:hypothetical protein